MLLKCFFTVFSSYFYILLNLVAIFISLNLAKIRDIVFFVTIAVEFVLKGKEDGSSS